MRTFQPHLRLNCFVYCSSKKKLLFTFISIQIDCVVYCLNHEHGRMNVQYLFGAIGGWHQEVCRFQKCRYPVCTATLLYIVHNNVAPSAVCVVYVMNVGQYVVLYLRPKSQSQTKIDLINPEFHCEIDDSSIEFQIIMFDQNSVILRLHIIGFI